MGSSQVHNTTNSQLGIGAPKANYNDFIKDIYNGIKSINNSINQITNAVIRMEQRLDTLETGLTTVSHAITTLNDKLDIQTENIAKQNITTESALLTRLDLIDIDALAPHISLSMTTEDISAEQPTFTNNNETAEATPVISNIQTTDDYDTLILD